MSSSTAEGPAAVVLAKWECTKDSEEVTCICEGSEADCKSTVAKRSKVKGSEMQSGQVKRFNNAMGVGFITRENGLGVFVHLSAIVGNGYRSLSEGQCVNFIVSQRSEGPEAENVSSC